MALTLGSMTMMVPMSAKGTDPALNLVDLQFGLRDDVDVQKMKAVVKRFGITLPDKTFEGGINMKLSMPDLQPSFDGTPFFRLDKYSPSVEFNAKIFAPSNVF